jgi:hypothetical protein
MRVGLTFTQMKLGRAKQHLDELRQEVMRYAKDRAYTVTKRDDVQRIVLSRSIRQSQIQKMTALRIKLRTLHPKRCRLLNPCSLIIKLL